MNVRGRGDYHCSFWDPSFAWPQRLDRQMQTKVQIQINGWRTSHVANKQVTYQLVTVDKLTAVSEKW